MSKLVYPVDGIYRYCKIYIENGNRDLSRALNNSVLDIPNDFCYNNYLNGLGNIIKGYLNELDSIDSKLKKVNDNFNFLEEDLDSDTKKMIGIRIKDRDRMIV